MIKVLIITICLISITTNLLFFSILVNCTDIVKMYKLRQRSIILLICEMLVLGTLAYIYYH